MPTKKIKLVAIVGGDVFPKSQKAFDWIKAHHQQKCDRTSHGLSLMVVWGLVKWSVLLCRKINNLNLLTKIHRKRKFVYIS